MIELTPSKEQEAQEPLKLDVPAPVEKVEKEQISEFVPEVKTGRQLEIGNQAKQYVSLMSNDIESSDFSKYIKEINSIAQREITKSSESTSKILQRKTTSVAGSKKNGSDTSQKVAKTLTELRNTAEDLTPNAAALSKPRKLLGLIPMGNKAAQYVHKYESAQDQLDAIKHALESGQGELVSDNDSLAQEQQSLRNTMGQLNEYIVFSQKLDEEIQQKVNELKKEGRESEAHLLETEALFTVRQRHQDLLSQLSVAVQGYMAMDLVRKNNSELIRGVERAKTTTLFALKTAVVVASALDTQKMVVEQLENTDAVTNNMVLQTSELLKSQTGRIHQQALNSGVSVETISRSFDNVFATFDEIDTFKVRANESMNQTIAELGSEMNRIKPRIENAYAIENMKKNSGLIEN